jgi:hypothetical protein
VHLEPRNVPTSDSGFCCWEVVSDSISAVECCACWVSGLGSDSGMRERDGIMIGKGESVVQIAEATLCFVHLITWCEIPGSIAILPAASAHGRAVRGIIS